jgi:hypothetical protein
VNCPLERLDGAAVRSGRLLAYREFGRVPPERAERIAEANGLRLEPRADYSLAEIFAGESKAPGPSQRKIAGFAAAS